MTTETPAEPQHRLRTDDELSLDDCFSLLASERRRAALRYLCQRVGAVSLGDLAERLAQLEDDPSYDHYEHVLTSLHHAHLPKLADGGLVHYDADAETIRATDALGFVLPILDAARADDSA